MKLRNILLITAALPLLGACVAYEDPYYGANTAYYNGGPTYYDAYPTHTYIEYNQSYSHRGGYRENYWAHDRAREEHWRNDHPAPAPRPEHHEDRGNHHNDDHGWRGGRR